MMRLAVIVARGSATAVAVAAAYLLSATLSLVLDTSHGLMPLLWAPAGVALAAVILLGSEAAIGVAIGAAIWTLLRGRTFGTAVWIGGVDAIDALVSAWILAYVGFHRALRRPRDVIALVAVAVFVSMASATAGVAWLTSFGEIALWRAPMVWSRWWWGHVGSEVLVTSLLLVWSAPQYPRAHTSRQRMIEAVALTVATAVVALSIFYPWFPDWLPGRGMTYYLLPLWLWAGLRFPPRVTTIANVTLAALATTATAVGEGPFANETNLQTFIAITAASTLFLSALGVDRARATRRICAIERGALDAIITCEPSGRIVACNPAGRALFRIGDDLKGLCIGDVLPALSHDIGPQEGVWIRVVARRLDGDTFTGELSRLPTPVEDEDLFTLFVRDISVEERAEEALRASHDHLEENVRERTAELVEANAALARRDDMLRESQALAHLGSFEYGVEGDALDASDELYRILGIAPIPLTLTMLCEYFHPEDREEACMKLSRARSEREPFTFEPRIVRGDGAVRLLRCDGTLESVGGYGSQRVAVCCQDVTERVQAEVARRVLADLVASSDDAIIGLSLEGRIETWNDAAEHTFGYAAIEALGKPASMLVPNDNVAEQQRRITAALTGHRNQHYELAHVRRDGMRFEASVTTSPIIAHDSRVIGISKVVRDISERKAADEQLLHSLREKDVLLREIHHRVKNNLQVVSSLLNLQLATAQSEASRQALVESQARIQSMAIVHQLLYYSKDLAHIELQSYLEQLVPKLARTYPVGVEISTTISAPGIGIDIDHAIPCGLITNELVTNSLIHAFPGRERGRIEVTGRLDDGIVTLAVHDDGIGIPAAVDIETAQTFGLQIVRILAQQLDGRIELERAAGTTVRLVFPLGATAIVRAA